MANPLLQDEFTEQNKIITNLQPNEAQYNAVVEDPTELICRFLPDGTLSFVNEAYCRYFGKSGEELIGINFLQFIPQEEQANIHIYLSSFGLENQVASFEHRVITSNGEIRWLQRNDRAFFNDQGEIVEFQSIGRDITERKPAEEALRISERTFRELVDILPIAVYICDSSGLIESYNQRAVELWGRAPKYKDIADCFCGSYKMYNTDGTYLPHAECPMAQALRMGIPIANEEIVIERSDGSRRTAIVNILPRRDEQGNLTGAINCLTDITERNRAEETHRVFAAIVESSSDAIMSVDAKRRILSWNVGAQRVFGYTAEEAIGQDVSILAPPERREELKEIWKIVRNGEAVVNFETVRVRKDGTLIDVSLTISPIKDASGAVVATSAIVRDITEHKREKEEREELLRRLVTAQEEERHRIARELHDQMGQYLAALMIGLKLLGNSLESHPSANSNIAQLQELTLSFSQEMRRLALELRPSALDDLGLQTALINYLDEWSERYKIKIDFHSNGLNKQRLPLEIETTLYRVIQEALTNIQKHSQARRVSIILENRKGRVMAVLEDNGVGFDVEAALNAPAAERRLGLRGMRERVEAVGGTFEIESTPDVGTTIVARIPVKKGVQNE